MATPDSPFRDLQERPTHRHDAREEARALGRRGGRPRKLRLPEVEAAFGPLETAEDASPSVRLLVGHASTGI